MDSLSLQISPIKLDGQNYYSGWNDYSLLINQHVVKVLGQVRTNFDVKLMSQIIPK